MKRLLLLLGLLLILGACGGNKNLLHDDFKKDVEQVVTKLDAAYEENRPLSVEEINIIDKFQKKYEVGKFITIDNKEYEMNDLEKNIVFELGLMRNSTTSPESLASEKNAYEYSKSAVEEYLNAKKMPENLTSFPTYELYKGILPQFAEDARTIVDMFDPIINGNNTGVHQKDLEKLVEFVNKYKARKVEIDGKNYILDEDGQQILFNFEQLKGEVEKGSLTYDMTDRFNESKKLLGK